MGKRGMPYMEWYPTDYLADTRCVSLEARGAWADVLCEMHLAEHRGELAMPVAGYARLFGVSIAQAAVVLGELIEYGVASGAVSGEECNGPVTVRPQDHVTLVCRRMVREEEGRAQGRFRVRKCRERAAGVTPEKRAGNAEPLPAGNGDVTPTRAELPSSILHPPEATHTPSVVSPACVTPAPPGQPPEPSATDPPTGCGSVRECERVSGSESEHQSAAGAAEGAPALTPAEAALFAIVRECWTFVPRDWEDPEKIRTGKSSWPSWVRFLASGPCPGTTAQGRGIRPDLIRKAVWQFRDAKFPPTLRQVRRWILAHPEENGS